MQQRAMSSILALLVVGSAFTAALPGTFLAHLRTVYRGKQSVAKVAMHSAGRTILDTQTAIAISTPTTLAASSSPGASATAIRESLAQTPQLAPAPTPTWDYGICPLVVVDADFFGTKLGCITFRHEAWLHHFLPRETQVFEWHRMIAHFSFFSVWASLSMCTQCCTNCELYNAGNDIAEAKEPDVATCCNECLKSLNAWRATNASGVPSKTDNACVAWTFTVDKVCYLKNSAPPFPCLSPQLW